MVAPSLVLTFLAFFVTFVANPGFAQDISAPKIDFPEKDFDLGKVEEGVELRHTFKISNLGSKLLLIKSAFSTCGCTVPHLKKKEIKPGETVDLEVMMDTSMKQGKVDKQIEIHSNDPTNPVATLHIKADVKGAHADLGEDKTAKIFSGRCAACHVQKGIGKSGEELFFADCAMCHGFRGGGIPGVAPPLVPADYHNQEFSDYRKRIVSFGSKTHRSMPGYLDRAGGPLTEKEIDSLIDYLRRKSDLETGKKP